MTASEPDAPSESTTAVVTGSIRGQEENIDSRRMTRKLRLYLSTAARRPADAATHRASRVDGADPLGLLSAQGSRRRRATAVTSAGASVTFAVNASEMASAVSSPKFVNRLSFAWV